MKNQSYYDEVDDYYTEEADEFEERYWKNPMLMRIRQSFREHVKKKRYGHALEIGFGSGLDLVHFAHILPETQWYGIDVSEGMVRVCRDKVKTEDLCNIRVEHGSVEDIEEKFEGQKFDLIFVFFGALNTVNDLEEAAAYLRKNLSENGEVVLTFVNKWYIGGMVLESLKLKFASAFARLKPIWGGYSPTKNLNSKCYSPKEIRQAFSQYNIVYSRGYSILYPAWYYMKVFRLAGKRVTDLLWKIDERFLAQRFAGFGEYTLFKMKKKR